MISWTVFFKLITLILLAMEEDLKKKQFNKRAFISTALLVSGLSLPLSGFMNHYLQFD